MEEIKDIKVSAKTEVHLLRRAISGYLKSGLTLYMDCIGVDANYVATKAMVKANQDLLACGKALFAEPFFEKLPSNNLGLKIAIRWVVIAK